MKSKREAILKIIGRRGYCQQNRFFMYADEHDSDMGRKRARNPLREQAESYAQYRREHIEAVRRGEFAKYGITEADIVE